MSIRSIHLVSSLSVLVACSAAPSEVGSSAGGPASPAPSATRGAQAPAPPRLVASPEAGTLPAPSPSPLPVAVCSIAGANQDLAMNRPSGDLLYLDSTIIDGGSCIAHGGGCSFSILSCPAGGTDATPKTVVHGVLELANGVAANGQGSFDYELAVGDPAGGLGLQGLYRFAHGKTSHLTRTGGRWKTDVKTGHVFFPDPVTADQLDALRPEGVVDAGAAPQMACVSGGIWRLEDFAASNGRVFVLDGVSRTIIAYTEEVGGCSAGATVATGVSGESSLVADDDGTRVYFADARGVHACAADGSGCATLATGQGTVTRLVYDGANVYWIGAAGLVGCAKGGCGGAPRVLLAGVAVASPIEVDLDGPNVYFVDQAATVGGGATLYRLAK